MTAYLYARVSRDDLTCSNQVHEVAAAGIHYDEVVCDVVSGAVAGADRDGLGALLQRLVRGDRVIVTKVDRLGRRASDVLALVEGMRARGVGVVVVQLEGMDLTSSMGKLMLTMLGACAEFERNLISERTKAGLARARSEGVVLGKPAPAGSLETVRSGLAAGLSVSAAAAAAGVSRQAVYQWREKGLLTAVEAL